MATADEDLAQLQADLATRYNKFQLPTIRSLFDLQDYIYKWSEKRVCCSDTEIEQPHIMQEVDATGSPAATRYLLRYIKNEMEAIKRSCLESFNKNKLLRLETLAQAARK